MNKEEILKDLQERFKVDIVDICDKTAKRSYIEIKPEAIRRVGKYIFKDLGARFSIASGVDCHFHLEILYHFTFDELNFIISLRVKLNREKPEIDSLATEFEAANWIEREMNEMLGIAFKGHPDMRPLLLPDDWPKGLYPLRKEYKEWDDKAVRDRGIK